MSDWELLVLFFGEFFPGVDVVLFVEVFYVLVDGGRSLLLVGWRFPGIGGFGGAGFFTCSLRWLGGRLKLGRYLRFLFLGRGSFWVGDFVAKE